ncbi:MAG: cyclic nucleotide-binding domain-containing protein [Kiritimatiellae bacterium]|nr:cyclic nucleotide-binding domain-containing protein [Kiritimatiellia bacterium]
MTILAYGETDIGMVRQTNEDSLLVHAPPDSDVALIVVADGVGGSRGGDVASKMLVENVRAEFEAVRDRFAKYTAARDRKLRFPLLRLLRKIMASTTYKIFSAAAAHREYAGMSTTAVVLILANEGAFIAHAGDSRAYLVRDGWIYRLTEDHTLTSEQLASGKISPAEADTHQEGHILTRSIGAEPKSEIDTVFLRVQPHDRFLLCSDGLHAYITGNELRDLSSETRDPERLVQYLIGEAKRRGSQDNITLAVAEPLSEQRARPEMALHAKIKFLRRLVLFDDLSDYEILHLLRIIYTQKRAKGEHIIREGEEGDELFVLVDGTAGVTLKGRTLSAIGPGGHFGEMSLTENVTRSATVTALSDVTLLTIKQSDFMRILKDDPPLATKLLLKLLRQSSSRLRSMSKEVSQTPDARGAGRADQAL